MIMSCLCVCVSWAGVLCVAVKAFVVGVPYSCNVHCGNGPIILFGATDRATLQALLALRLGRAAARSRCNGLAVIIGGRGAAAKCHRP